MALQLCEAFFEMLFGGVTIVRGLLRDALWWRYNCARPSLRFSLVALQLCEAFVETLFRGFTIVRGLILDSLLLRYDFAEPLLRLSVSGLR